MPSLSKYAVVALCVAQAAFAAPVAFGNSDDEWRRSLSKDQAMKRDEAPAPLPSHVTIECLSGKCSESDLGTLSHVLDILEHDKNSAKNWQVSSSIQAVDGKKSGSIKLTRRDDMPKNEGDLAGLNLAQIQHCAANDCSAEELSAVKQQLELAVNGIPVWLWPILDRIKKLKFAYDLDYGANAAANKAQ